MKWKGDYSKTNNYFLIFVFFYFGKESGKYKGMLYFVGLCSECQLYKLSYPEIQHEYIINAYKKWLTYIKWSLPLDLLDIFHP